jgi:hypothetical protein
VMSRGRTTKSDVVNAVLAHGTNYLRNVYLNFRRSSRWRTRIDWHRMGSLLVVD